MPEFHSPDYTLETVQGWHQAGRHNDLIRMLEAPYNRPAPTKIPAGRLELDFGGTGAFVETSLPVRQAVARMELSDGARAELFVHATRPLGMFRVEGARGLVPRLVPPSFGGRVDHAASGGIGAGDLAQLGYPAPKVASGPGWSSYLQQGAGGFSFAVHLAWRSEGASTVGAWSIASSAEGTDPSTTARRRAEQGLAEGYDPVAASHQRWWNRYWEASSIEVPNPVLQRQWELENYKFGAASRRGAPPITLQGPWTADDGQLPPWKGDYHHDLNTQLSYWPCYSANHLEEGLAYLDWLWATRSNCVAWTRQFFGLPGMNVPMTADLLNRQIGGWRQYTHSCTTAAWLAQHFYLHWKYSGDRAFLRDRAWPYLREASRFIEAVSARRSPSGYRTLPLSSSPEIHDNSPAAWFPELTNYDLALMRWLTGATAELAQELALGAEAAHWRGVLAEFPPFALSERQGLLVAPGAPLTASHRHFSHLMAIHPLGLIDVRDGPSEARTVGEALDELDRLGPSQWCGYSYAWLGNLAARAREGTRAERALEIFATAFTLRNSFHCNGDQSGNHHSGMTYRPFTLEGNFAAAAGLQEMLLQSHRGRIELFPAIPSSWSDAGFTTLRAQGAFLVSAERRQGRVSRVIITSEQGAPCTLLSPWSGRELRLRIPKGGSMTLTHDPGR